MRTQTDVGRLRAAAAQRALALRVVECPARELVDFLIPVESPLVIGRGGPPRQADAAEATIAISDMRLSARHVAVYPRPVQGRSAVPALQLLDLESKNGCFLNGERVTAGQLTEGDLLRVGQTLFVTTRSVVAGALESPADELIGQAPALLEAWERARAGAERGVPVLVRGETGTGKEGVARLVHRASGRRGPFIALNCATLSGETATATLFGHDKGAFTGAAVARRGVFGEAEGGTLFLDEIGDLPLEIQPRLLRALEQREVTPIGSARPKKVDVQLVFATHADLAERALLGTFRPDLYARLATWVIELPPLRERREDILRLARAFAGASAAEPLFEPEAAEALLLHRFPYNVRELRQVMTKLALAGERPWSLEAVLAALPAAESARTAANSSSPADDTQPGAAARLRRGERPSREELVALLERSGGNVAAVARELGRDRKQIYRWLTLYQIAHSES